MVRLLPSVRELLLSLACGSIVANLIFSPAASAVETDINIFQTKSAKTVSSSEYELDYRNAPMPNLKVTVSQTKNLTDQGLDISWTGAAPNSARPESGGGSNFLQIFQCWGEDPYRPGHPDRTTCQYGSSLGPGTSRSDTTTPDSVDPQDTKFTKPGTNYFNPPYTSIPFNSATGEQVWDLKLNNAGVLEVDSSVSMASNQFFSRLTSNEVAWAGSDSSGNGNVKFELQTASTAPGLGCGTATKVGTKFVGQPCWLVILPRGLKDNRQNAILQSGLFWDAWKHHLAVKLDFRPIGVRCAIGVPERLVQGSELAGAAFASWQPRLCNEGAKSAFVISNQFDGDALESASSDETSPLAITTRAVGGEADDSLVYAPLAIGGISVTFLIDRRVDETKVIPSDLRSLDQTPFESLRLTPRLIAKLLTGSYTDSLPPLTDLGAVSLNPRNITQDPDFIAVNNNSSHWAYMDLKFGGIGDALVPNSRSFLAERVWTYIISDSEGRDFMAGKPDPFGMKINPWFSTDKNFNPSGTAFAMPNLGFPKNDPVEKPDTTATGGISPSGPINVVTWRPYLSDFEEGAKATLTGNAYELGGWDNNRQPPAFAKTPRSPLGFRKVFAITTTPAAERFQSFQAALRNPAGEFVSPTLSSLQLAQNAMTPSEANQEVYELNFDSQKVKKASGAYPLAVPIYAAINPLQSQSDARVAYADLIKFAVSEGQTPGTEIGDLPPGYAPLNPGFVKTALAVAKVIRNGGKEPNQDSNVDQEVSPEVIPSPQPTQQVIAAGMTPNNPELPLSVAAVPFAIVLFLCSLIFYGLIRIRFFLVNPRRTLL
jgi:hypothetical protein